MSNGACLEALWKRLSQKDLLKDTTKEKAPNNTPALSKCANIDICVVGTSNQLFIKGS